MSKETKEPIPVSISTTEQDAYATMIRSCLAGAKAARKAGNLSMEASFISLETEAHKKWHTV